MDAVVNHDFYLVGIGASAGGLTAIQKLFDNIPEDTGMAFVIVQHLSPDYKSLMPELLSKHTRMEIFTSEDQQEIRPNCIYLNQRNKNIKVEGNRLCLLERASKHELNLPIDIFFHSVGKEFKEKSIGIILSGTGSDGSRGIKTIKETGGTIIVEDPFSAQFDGMPNSAISTNLVDYVLPPDKMAVTLTEITTKTLNLLNEEQQVALNEVIFFNILDDIHLSCGIDFRHYKRNTLLRRIEKRMNINNIETIKEYQIFLSNNKEEKEILKKDFFIGVTSFFRDPEAFESLKLNVIPELVKNNVENSEPIRIWVPGCSTGEEVFSIAMLMDDYIQRHKPTCDFKIFATDVDANALNKASQAVFHINATSELNPEYLEKYFVKTSDKIQIIKRIRKKILFSMHNILSDPPFIHMDLISCRNMLIYVNNVAQQNIFKNFLFSLNKNGYLFLGSSETLGDAAKYFKALDSKWKIYQNISEMKVLPSHIPDLEAKTLAIPYKTPFTSFTKTDYQFDESPERAYEKYLNRKFSPDSLFFDKDFNVVYINGKAGARLMLQEGLFQNNLLKMSSPEVAAILKEGIGRLGTSDKDVCIKDVTTKKENKIYTFDLTFHKTSDSVELSEIYMVSFSQEKLSEENVIELKNISGDELSKQRVKDLETELQNSKSKLQNVVEELETSNEELQSSNEELMASNEELQSTNEELQSVNEELYTVNAELQEKNKELQHLNDDINNLLNSTDIGTLFLDPNLCIRKYTSALQKHFNLQESDIGRSIVSFAPNFDENTRQSIINDSRKALKQYAPIEEEIRDNMNNYYLRRITPFVTSDKIINGVVITFVEITQLKNIQEELTAKTCSLEKSVKELERFNKAAIGRELKMIELKRSINELKVKLGEQEPFDLSFLENSDNPDKKESNHE